MQVIHLNDYRVLPSFFVPSLLFRGGFLVFLVLP